MSYEQVEELATGMFYLGQESKELGLVDELGGMQEAEEILKVQLNVTEIQLVEFEEAPGFLEAIAGVLSRPAYYLGQGIGSSIFKAEEKPKIVV